MDEKAETMKAAITIEEILELDLGIEDYMQYIEALGGKPPAYGTRDNSKRKMSLRIYVEGPTNGDEEEAIDHLYGIAKAKIDEYFSGAREYQETEEIVTRVVQDVQY
jgi:hypothetical protein